jgi:NAD(P)H dehydrogenase (quinone)
MKHLVVAAHPVEGSFTMALTHAYTLELERLGHQQRTRDLYRLRFNPILSAAELAADGTRCPVNTDVSLAQDDIRWADALTVIYPLWWLSMPAIMKGYIDRVFSRGFAFESHGGIVRGLLSGKSAVLITISGAPQPLLVQSGNWNAVQVLQDTHVFHSTGFTLLEHVHFDEVVPGLSNTIVTRHLERVRLCARNHFSV